jgi:hypothetical protein
MNKTTGKVVTALALAALSAEFVIGDRILKTLAEPVSPHIETGLRPETPTLDLIVVSATGNAFKFDRYRLSVAASYLPDPTSPVGRLMISLRAMPHAGFSDARQEMFGSFSTIDQLGSVLGRILPRRQLRLVRRILLAGRATEIGGSRSGVVREFSEQTLHAIGMSFRPIDS